MTGEMPRVSVVVPAYNEGDQILPVLDRLFESVHLQCEVLVVVDDQADTTVPVVTEYALKEPRIRCLVNTYGPGPANAIRFGIDAAAAPVTVVTMADGCDDPRQIDDLARLVDRGVAVAAASRYMPGGQQVGGPVMKGFLSKSAGRSLRLLAHTGTRDATNSFKAYSTSFLRKVGIDSRHGFEIGIELTAKAKRLRLPVAEIPTIWLDRQAGVSNFKVAKWVPSYVHWYCFAFGPQLTADEVRAAVEAGRQIAHEEVDAGADLLIAGDMGIGNTTAATTLVAVITGTEPVAAVGRGTGIDDAGWMRKTTAVRNAMYRARHHAGDPMALLQTCGGADLAAMAGFCAQAAVRRTPLLLDGVVVTAAALVADRLAPGARQWWQAGHRSTEPAHSLALAWLDLEPIVDLKMRLGEGTGALVAVPIVRAAVATLASMATFGEASVTDRPQ